MERGSPPPATAAPPAPANLQGFGAFCSALTDTLTNMATTSRSRPRRKTAAVAAAVSAGAAGGAGDEDERPPVPAPSDAVLNNLRTAFALVDRDRDGTVTMSELQLMLDKLGIQVKPELLQDLLHDASTQGNGLIDENDFMQWVSKIQALQAAAGGGEGSATAATDTEDEITRDLLAAFKVFDRDDNGYITLEELRAALDLIGEPLTDAQLSQVLALGDLDHDGRIDYEEFVKMLL